jgi:hypothetical protein
MCFNQPSSLAALAVGLATAYAAFAYRYTVLSVLIFIVALMQLSEFLIWRGLDSGASAIVDTTGELVDGKTLNRAGTALARTTLGLHGLAVCIAALVFAMPVQRWRRYGLVLCTLVAIAMYELTVDAPYGQTTRAGCASGCRLKWGFMVHPYSYNTIFAVIFLALLLSRVPLLQTLCIVLFYGLTWVAALVTAEKGRVWEAISTSWCYACSFGSPLLVGTMVGLGVAA